MNKRERELRKLAEQYGFTEAQRRGSGHMQFINDDDGIVIASLSPSKGPREMKNMEAEFRKQSKKDKEESDG